jgi:hypothetical protein
MVAQGRIVDERGDAPPRPLDTRRDAARALLRQRDAMPVDIDERVASDGVGDLERGVAKRTRKGLAQLSGRGRLPQLDDQSRDRRARQPAAQQTGEEGKRHRQQGHDPQRLQHVGAEARERIQRGPHRGQDHGRPTCQIDRREHTSQRRRRSPPTPHQNHHDRHEEADDQPERRESQSDGERRVAID